MTTAPRLVLDFGSANIKVAVRPAAGAAQAVGFGVDAKAPCAASLLYIGRGADLLLPRVVETNLDDLLEHAPEEVIAAISRALEGDPNLAALDEAMAAGANDPEGVIADVRSALGRRRLRRPGREVSSILALCFVLRRVSRQAGRQAAQAKLVVLSPEPIRADQFRRLAAAGIAAGFTRIENSVGLAPLLKSLPGVSKERVLAVDLGHRASRAELFEYGPSGWTAQPLPVRVRSRGTRELEAAILALAAADPSSRVSPATLARLRTGLGRVGDMALETQIAQFYRRDLLSSMRDFAGALSTTDGGAPPIGLLLTGGGTLLPGVASTLGEIWPAHPRGNDPLRALAIAWAGGDQPGTALAVTRQDQNLDTVARSGDPWAALTLAEEKLLKGDGPSNVEAAGLLAQAAEAGLAPAMTRLASLQLEGRIVEKSGVAALAWLERAAARGDAEAMAILGTELLRTVEKPETAERARRLLERAATFGAPRAELALALNHLKRDGRDGRDKAVTLLRHAAEAGLPEAMRELAALLAPVDRASQLRWLEMAGDAGDVTAMLDAGSLAPDRKRQVSWLERAARAGSAEASLQLAESARWRPSLATHHLQRAKDLNNVDPIRITAVESSINMVKRLRQRAATACVLAIVAAGAFWAVNNDATAETAALENLGRTADGEEARQAALAYLNDGSFSSGVAGVLLVRRSREVSVREAYQEFRNRALTRSDELLGRLRGATMEWPLVPSPDGGSASQALALQPLADGLEGRPDDGIRQTIRQLTEVGSLGSLVSSAETIRLEADRSSAALRSSGATRATLAQAREWQINVSEALKQLDKALPDRGTSPPVGFIAYRERLLQTGKALDQAITRRHVAIACAEAAAEIAQASRTGGTVSLLDELRRLSDESCPDRRPVAQLAQQLFDFRNRAQLDAAVMALQRAVGLTLDKHDVRAAKQTINEGWRPEFGDDRQRDFSNWLQTRLSIYERSEFKLSIVTENTMMAAQQTIAVASDNNFGPFTYLRPRDIQSNLDYLKCRLDEAKATIKTGAIVTEVEFAHSTRTGWYSSYIAGDPILWRCRSDDGKLIIGDREPLNLNGDNVTCASDNPYRATWAVNWSEMRATKLAFLINQGGSHRLNSAVEVRVDEVLNLSRGGQVPFEIPFAYRLTLKGKALPSACVP